LIRSRRSADGCLSRNFYNHAGSRDEMRIAGSVRNTATKL